jgi:hypothetical protein
VITPEHERNLQFPIVTSEVDWEKKIKRSRLRHVEPRAQEIIKANQPYKMTPSRPLLAHLLTLGELDDADKHHETVQVGLVPGVVKINWPNEVRDTQLVNPYPPVEPAKDAEFGRFVFDSHQAEDALQIDFKWGFTIWIGYWPYYDIRFVIDNYVRSVRYIVGQLAELLP